MRDAGGHATEVSQAKIAGQARRFRHCQLRRAEWRQHATFTGTRNREERRLTISKVELATGPEEIIAPRTQIFGFVKQHRRIVHRVLPVERHADEST